MLSPRYLAGCTDDIVKIYAQLEHDIVTDMARRLAKMGEVTEASEWQAKIFKEIGGLQQDIYKHLKKYDAIAQKRIAELFTEALEKSTAADTAVINTAMRKMSDAQSQILEATLEKVQNAAIVTGSKKVKEEAKNGAIKVFSGLSRLTMSIAETGSSEFISAANAAYMKVASGAFDYNTALKQAVTALANKGVYTVEYTDSGTRRLHTIEGAVRANIMTGINQTAQQITQNNCQELGCDLVEVSAHMGARPSHAAWQGKIYSLSGTSDKYPSFYEVCRPGEPDGICGINCRHSYYPYFEGTEPQYTDGELDEMREPKVKLNGQEITQYEAEQKLRACERNVRKYKRVADANAAAGLDNTHERKIVGEWQAAARDICKQTGIPREYSREFIGTTAGKQAAGMKPGSIEAKAERKATQLFPDEKWEKASDNIFIAENRKALNKQEVNKLTKELEMAKVAQKYGHTTYLVPEKTTGKKDKKYDAIMDGVKTEFKKITGNENSIQHRFRDGLKQGQNEFLQIDTDISVTRIKQLLHGVLKDKSEINGLVYCYLTKHGKLYCWKMSDLK